MEALLLTVLTFFTFGHLGFILGLLVLSVVYTIASECDAHGFTIFSTVLGVVLFWKTVSLSFAVWPLLLIGIASYLLIGGAWSVFRWFKYCRKFIYDNPYIRLSINDTKDWRDGKEIKLSAHEYYKKKLRPSEYKSRLIGWITYWPWSVFWNVAGDSLTAVYDTLVNVYEKTSDAVIKKALDAEGR